MKHRIKVRGQRKIYHDNVNKKQNKKTTLGSYINFTGRLQSKSNYQG